MHGRYLSLLERAREREREIGRHTDRETETSVYTCYLFSALYGCPSPTNVPNAVHDGSSVSGIFEIGIMVQYECLPGFEETSDTAVVRAWCVRGGEWMGPNMTCTSKRYRA